MIPQTLVLGCGSKRKPGAVHVDHRADAFPQVVHDLNAIPCPRCGTKEEPWSRS